MCVKFKELNKSIIHCKKCPRLVKFINKVSTQKRKQNINEIYWGKPVPGFGNSNSKLAIIGLAPAAHGGTRTGRAFTGDKSGDFLFKCLYEAGISNHIFSVLKSMQRHDELTDHRNSVISILEQRSSPKEYVDESTDICNSSHLLHTNAVQLTVQK